MLFKYVLKFRGSNYLQFETTVLKDFLDFSIQITDDISLFMRKKKFKMYNVYYKVRTFRLVNILLIIVENKYFHITGKIILIDLEKSF